jgi:hypothetical protein
MINEEPNDYLRLPAYNLNNKKLGFLVWRQKNGYAFQSLHLWQEERSAQALIVHSRPSIGC